jgi:hypothetical protein
MYEPVLERADILHGRQRCVAGGVAVDAHPEFRKQYLELMHGIGISWLDQMCLMLVQLQGKAHGPRSRCGGQFTLNGTNKIRFADAFGDDDGEDGTAEAEMDPAGEESDEDYGLSEEEEYSSEEEEEAEEELDPALMMDIDVSVGGSASHETEDGDVDMA